MSMFDTPANTPVVAPQGQGDYNQGDKGRPGEGRKGPIGTYMNYVNDFIKLTSQNRRQQVTDVMYYHGNQLSPKERQELDKRGQPILIINRTRAAVNGMLGVQVQQNTQARAWPRTPNDEDSADVATDVLRYISDATQLKKQKHDIFYHLLVAGVGGCVLELDKNGQDINVKAFDWNEIIYDPRSRKKDFSDAGYLGFMKWAYADDVKMLYPSSGFDVSNIGTGGLAGLADDAGVDRPRMGGWISVDKKRVLLVELHYKESGVWYKVVFTAAGVLEEGEDWLKDDKGEYYCPVLAASPYVDDDNNRYGVVRDMRSIQDEINKRRSKLLHMLNVAQIQAVNAMAVEVNADEAREEAARPDGVIPQGWERVRNQDLVQGQQMLLAESKAELERMGPNPAILGRQGADTSGKALAARQDAGMVELAPVFTVMDDLELRIYRTAWLIAKQYWTGPMFVRITDEIDDPRFVGINQPQMGMVQGIDQTTGQPATDPATGQPIMVQDVLGYKNSLAELDVDIVIDTVPGTANLQAEQLANLMDLIARNPTYAEQVPATVLFELTPMPRKREMMQKIQAAQQQASQQKQQAEAQQQQIQMAGAQAKIADVQSRAALNNAKAQEAGFNAVSYANQVANGRDQSAQQLQLAAQQWLEKREMERAGLALQQQELNQPQEGAPAPAGPNQSV